MIGNGGQPAGFSGLPVPLRTAHAWPGVPCVGDLIPAGLELCDAAGRRRVAARWRGRCLRVAALESVDGQAREILINQHGRVIQVRLMPQPPVGPS